MSSLWLGLLLARNRLSCSATATHRKGMTSTDADDEVLSVPSTRSIEEVYLPRHAEQRPKQGATHVPAQSLCGIKHAPAVVVTDF